MADLNNDDYHSLIFDRIENAIIALSDSVPFLPCKFLTTRWTRVIGQSRDPSQYSPSVGFGYTIEILPDGRLEFDLIFCHPPST